MPVRTRSDGRRPLAKRDTNRIAKPIAKPSATKKSGIAEGYINAGSDDKENIGQAITSTRPIATRRRPQTKAAAKPAAARARTTATQAGPKHSATPKRTQPRRKAPSTPKRPMVKPATPQSPHRGQRKFDRFAVCIDGAKDIESGVEDAFKRFGLHDNDLSFDDGLRSPGGSGTIGRTRTPRRQLVRRRAGTKVGAGPKINVYEIGTEPKRTEEQQLQEDIREKLLTRPQHKHTFGPYDLTRDDIDRVPDRKTVPDQNTVMHEPAEDFFLRAIHSLLEDDLTEIPVHIHWCHLLAFCLFAGKINTQDSENLVAGTSKANYTMKQTEMRIRDLVQKNDLVDHVSLEGKAKLADGLVATIIKLALVIHLKDGQKLPFKFTFDALASVTQSSCVAKLTFAAIERFIVCASSSDDDSSASASASASTSDDEGTALAISG